MASPPKEAMCVVGEKSGVEIEGNCTPHEQQLEDDLCHDFEPCNQASCTIQLEWKLDHPPRPALINFDQQNLTMSSLHCMNLKESMCITIQVHVHTSDNLHQGIKKIP